MIHKQLLKQLTFCIAILSPIISFAQSEVIIEDIGSDKEVTIELETDDSILANHRHMHTGIKNDQGYLKTVSNNDLSFWTNSTRRMTIENNGNVGLGTSNPQDLLHIKTGRFRIQVPSAPKLNLIFAGSLDFDFSNNKVGGVAYSPFTISPFSPEAIVFKNNLEGVINLNTGNQPRLIIKEDGGIRIPWLAQGKPANVYVDNQGNLKTNIVDKVINITPLDLRYDYTPTEITPHLVRGKHLQSIPLFASVDIPSGSVVTEAIIYYVDNSSSSNLSISFTKGKHNSGSASLYTTTSIFDSTGSPSSSNTDIKKETVSLNYTVINDDVERTNLTFILPSSALGISSIVLIYN